MGGVMRSEKLSALAVGSSIPHVSISISPEMARAFCELIEDRNPVHFDDAFARKKGFPAAVSHSAIGSSLLLRMLSSFLGAWPLEGDHLDISYRVPILVGDTITARAECNAREVGSILCEVWCENQKGQKVITGNVRIVTE
jgi:acyl dehydratase